MIIDIIAAGLIILSLFKGLRNGFVLAVFSFLAFVIGLAAALKLSALVADYLGTNTSIGRRWLPVLAFVIVFFIVALLVRLLAKALEGVVRAAMLGWLNRIGGIVLYALLYFFVFSIILFYMQKLGVFKPATLQASLVYPYIQPLGPKVIGVLGFILPVFKNMFAELEHFFDQLSKKTS